MTQLYTSVGLTALPYSGKTTVSDVLVAELDYKQISHSAILRDEALRRGATLPLSRDDYMQTYLDMIAQHGRYVLAEMTLERAGRTSGIVIDGIRTIYEIEFYRENLPGFFALGLDASKDEERSRMVRFGRMMQSPRTDVAKMTYAEFEQRDLVELGAGHPFYSVKKCLKIANEIILNDGKIENLESLVRQLIKQKFRTG